MEQQLNATAGAAGAGILSWISNPITQVLLWPLLGCFIIGLIPATKKAAIRWTALIAALLSLVSSVLMLTGAGRLTDMGLQIGGTQWFPLGQYLRFIPDPRSGMQFVQQFHWMAIRFGETQSFGVDYFVGVDGLSMPLVLLCTVVLVMVVLWAWKREERVKEFMALTLFMQTGIIGSFVALDYVLLYLFWEWMLIPMFFLIAGWGRDQQKATKAAIKFFIYTLLGSVFMLIAFIQFQVFAQGNGVYTFSIPDMIIYGQNAAIGSLPISARMMMFFGLLIGFAVKAPMWPFHTWLPDAHSEAPTEMSVILAALMLKCGTYAFLRALYPSFPDICYHAGPIVAFCGVVAIVYGAGITLMQTDLKRMVAYSSISHMGFIILGISAMNPVSTTGAIFHMVGHGLVIALLFFLVGWIEERYGTRDMRELSALWNTSPQVGGLLTIAAFAGMGFPGLIAFWGELFILQGTYFNNPQWQTVILPGPGALIAMWQRAVGSMQGFMDNQVWFGPQAQPALTGSRFLQVASFIAVLGVLTSAVYMINMLMKVVFSGRRTDQPGADTSLTPQPAGAPLAELLTANQPVLAYAGAGAGGGTAATAEEVPAAVAAPESETAVVAALRRGLPGAGGPQLFGLAWNQSLVLFPLAAAIIFFGLNPQPLISLFADIGNLLAQSQWSN